MPALIPAFSGGGDRHLCESKASSLTIAPHTVVLMCEFAAVRRTLDVFEQETEDLTLVAQALRSFPCLNPYTLNPEALKP